METTNLTVPAEHDGVFKNAEHSALALIKIWRLLKYDDQYMEDTYREISKIVEDEVAAHPEGYPQYLEEKAHRETI